MKKRDESEDIDFEPEEELGSAGALKAKMQKLRDELEEVKKERQEYLDGWQRAKADAVNVKKEAEQQGRRSGELLREALVHDIIPALDSFDMAAGSEAWAEVNDGFRTGMEQVQQQLLGALRSHGIERYGKVGEKADPALYDVLEERDDAPGASQEVIKVLRYGYKCGERVLRPAQVIVKK